MKIALINVPLKDAFGQWIPVPPVGYGGIQWVVANLLSGYLDLGHRVWLLGAPTTTSSHPHLNIVNVAEPKDIYNWLEKFIDILGLEIIHDHSNSVFIPQDKKLSCRIVSTHHLTGSPRPSDYHVYLSFAQRSQANDPTAAVIRIPVNPSYYTYSEEKEDYLLYLGRVSRWKGVYEAARFAHLVGMKLIIAGPAWEKEYFDEIMTSYPADVEYVGEVGGKIRQRLLSQAKALLAFSQSVPGPWGDIWCEPGATIVSEASVSGTPVISSTNGCLKEIVPFVGSVISEEKNFTSQFCLDVVINLPTSQKVRENAIQEWNYTKIAQQYIDLFHKQ